jgi:hypothetical protein
MQASLHRQSYRYKCQPVSGECPRGCLASVGDLCLDRGPESSWPSYRPRLIPTHKAPSTLRRTSLLTSVLVALSYWLPRRAYTTSGSVTPSSETTRSARDCFPDVCSQGRGARAARLPIPPRLTSCSKHPLDRGGVPGLSHYDSNVATTMSCHKLQWFGHPGFAALWLGTPERMPSPSTS